VFERKRHQMATTNYSRPLRATVSRSEARQIIDTAVAEAESMSTPVTVAVVDESGVLKHFERMDGAALVSVQTAMSKAYAAAAIEMPTDEFFAAIESDAAAVASFATRPGFALIAGGLPFLVEGQIAGAIGVAGAMTGEEDRRIAEAAVRDTGR
jgi:glc operon protein GlcG